MLTCHMYEFFKDILEDTLNRDANHSDFSVMIMFFSPWTTLLLAFQKKKLMATRKILRSQLTSRCNYIEM